VKNLFQKCPAFKCPTCGGELKKIKEITEITVGKKGWVWKCPKCGKMYAEWTEGKLKELTIIYKG
jgi:uncharacterized protein with PIN domain